MVNTMSNGGTRDERAAPCWMKLSIDSNMPAAWQSAARRFWRMVEALLEGRPPADVLIYVGARNRRLRIQFHARPPLPRWTGALLDRVARDLEDLVSAPEGLSDLPDLFDDTASTSVDSSADLLQQVERPPKSETSDLDLDGTPPDSAKVASCADESVVVFHDVAGQWAKSSEDPSRDTESARRMTHTIRRLHALGPTRTLRRPPDDWSAGLERLTVESPNFHRVIRSMIRPHLAMTSRGIRHRLPPILLVGPPGIGKTHFIRGLQRVMDVPALFVDMAAETSSSTLCGTSTFWANASGGRVFSMLAWGESGQEAVANPLVLIDEIDKVSADRYDPRAGLYSLLEAETAASFEDQAIPGVKFDASNIRFLLTANDASLIPAPLLSRMLAFDIEAPTQAQQADITRRMFAEMIDALGIALDRNLPDSVLRQASRLGPRECKVRLNGAIGLVIAAGKTALDEEVWMDAGGDGVRPKSRIGFM